jgi:hypothetical protein
MKRQQTTCRTVEEREPRFEAACDCQRSLEARLAKMQVELSARHELA